MIHAEIIPYSPKKNLSIASKFIDLSNFNESNPLNFKLKELNFLEILKNKLILDNNK